MDSSRSEVCLPQESSTTVIQMGDPRSRGQEIRRGDEIETRSVGSGKTKGEGECICKQG
jgi:hypothetical protein